MGRTPLLNFFGSTPPRAPNKLSHSASSSESVLYVLPTLSLTTEAKNSSSTWSDVVIAALPYREMQIACELSHVTQHSSHKNRKQQKQTEHPLSYPSTLLFLTYHLLSRNISPSSNPPPTAKKPSFVHQLLPTNVTQVCVISWSIPSYLKTSLRINNLALEFINATTHDASPVLFS